MEKVTIIEKGTIIEWDKRLITSGGLSLRVIRMETLKINNLKKS